MKKFIIFLSLILFSSYSLAGDENAQRRVLEEIYSALQKDYKSSMQAAFKNQIDGYFLMRLEDFTSTSGILRSRVMQNIIQLVELKKQWLTINNEETEKKAVQMTDILRELKKIKSDSYVLKSDLKDLVDGWQNRCTDQTLAYPDAFFLPKAEFSPSCSKLSPNAGSWSIGVTIRIGGGQVPSVSGASSYDTTGMACTSGTALGSYFGPWGTAAGAVIGLIAGAWISTLDYVNELQAQWELIGKIWKFQEDTINSFAVSSQAFIHERCKTLLADKTAENGPEISKALSSFYQDAAINLEATSDFLTEVKNKVEELRKKIGEYLDDLINKKLKLINESYFTTLKKHFEKSQTLDLEVIKFMDSNIFNLLNESKFQSYGTADAIWTAIIDGDIRFNPGNDLEAVNLNGSMMWNSSVPLFIERIQERVQKGENK